MSALAFILAAPAQFIRARKATAYRLSVLFISRRIGRA
jgi:hypothetical protein